MGNIFEQIKNHLMRTDAYTQMYEDKERAYKVANKEFSKSGKKFEAYLDGEYIEHYLIMSRNGLVHCSVDNNTPGETTTIYEGMWDYTDKDKRYAELISRHTNNKNGERIDNILTYRRGPKHDDKYSTLEGNYIKLKPDAPVPLVDGWYICNHKRPNSAYRFFKKICDKAIKEHADEIDFVK